MPDPNLMRPAIIEVTRRGRRPRYHRGATVSAGNTAVPEACNTDQAADTRVLTLLPDIPRPWAQLCRRCWRGTSVLAAADQLRTAQEGEPQ